MEIEKKDNKKKMSKQKATALADKKVIVVPSNLTGDPLSL